MIQRFRFILALAVVSAAADSAAPSAGRRAENLPTVAAVLARFVEVNGGRNALLRHKSMTVRGRFEAPARKLVVETEQRTKDRRAFWKATFPDGRINLSGYDGSVAWDVDPSGRVTLHDRDETLTVARDADMYYHLHVRDYFRSLDVVDVKEFNGRPCYHLKGVNNWGKPNEQFYDTESGLLLGYAFNTAWRGGKGDATATFEDYRDFGGIRMATKTTSRDGDDVSVSRVLSVTYDDVDDSVFVLPEQVRREAEAAKKESP